MSVTKQAPLTLAEWKESGAKRYGADMLKWRFRCPCCNVETEASEWRDAKAPEGAIAFSCIGRYLPGEPRDAFGGRGKGPCNYAGGGLFAINPVAVIGEDGAEHRLFDFAVAALSPPPAKPKRRKKPPVLPALSPEA